MSAALEAIYYQLHYPWSATMEIATLLGSLWVILFVAWFIIANIRRLEYVAVSLGLFLGFSGCLAIPFLLIWGPAETILKHWLKH